MRSLQISTTSKSLQRGPSLHCVNLQEPNSKGQLLGMPRSAIDCISIGCIFFMCLLLGFNKTQLTWKFAMQCVSLGRTTPSSLHIRQWVMMPADDSEHVLCGTRRKPQMGFLLQPLRLWIITCSEFSWLQMSPHSKGGELVPNSLLASKHSGFYRVVYLDPTGTATLSIQSKAYRKS